MHIDSAILLWANPNMFTALAEAAESTLPGAQPDCEVATSSSAYFSNTGQTAEDNDIKLREELKHWTADLALLSEASEL